MVKAVFTSHISHTPFTIIHVIFSYFIILSSQKKSCKIWILLLMTTPGCTKQLFRVVSVSLFYHLAVSHFSCYNTVAIGAEFYVGILFIWSNSLPAFSYSFDNNSEQWQHFITKGLSLLSNIGWNHLTLILKEQLAIVLPSAKKSQLTTAPLSPRQANAPRINPQGNASIRIAPTRALSSSGGSRRSHFNSWSFNTNTPLWLVCNLSICLRNTSVQNSLQRNFTASSCAF